MASGGRCVLLAVATSGILLSAGACRSFSAEDAGVTEPADGGADGSSDAVGDATVAADGSRDTNGCPTEEIFKDEFDGSSPSSVWTRSVAGGGAIAMNKPGMFVASVTSMTGDTATIEHAVTLPHVSNLVCIKLRVRLEGNPTAFSGGYVATMQNDVRANKNDTAFGFLGFGLDKTGVFTNIQDAKGASQSGHLMMSTMSTPSPPPFSNVIYKIESNGTTSLVTILLDGNRADQRTLQIVPQVGHVELQLGPDASSKGGGFGAVTFTLDSITVTAE